MDCSNYDHGEIQATREKCTWRQRAEVRGSSLKIATEKVSDLNSMLLQRTEELVAVRRMSFKQSKQIKAMERIYRIAKGITSWCRDHQTSVRCDIARLARAIDDFEKVGKDGGHEGTD